MWEQAPSPTASGGAAVSLDWGDEDVEDAEGPSTNPVVEGDDNSPMNTPPSIDLTRTSYHDRAGHNLIVIDHGPIVKQDHGSLVAPEAVLAPADVFSLGQAVRDERRCCSGLPETILVAREDPTSFDEALFNPDPVHIEVDDDHVYASADVLMTSAGVAATEYLRWLRPAAERHGCRVTIRLTDQYGQDEFDCQEPWFQQGDPEGYAEYLASRRARLRIVEMRVAPARAMVVAELLAAGRDAYALLNALRGGSVDAGTAADILLAGLPHLLIGLPESEWFEAKGQPYGLDAPGGAGTAAKIELAQDVARFANGDVAALLVIGLVTSKCNGGDVVKAVRPTKLSALSPERYRSIIDERVYPAVEGLRVEQVASENGEGLLMIRLPAQPAEYKPFLVHGAIVGNRVEGSFISIVRRRGEGSTAVTASQIHAALAAGRALLRGDPSERT